MKHCTRCGTVKPLDAFNKSPKGKFGRDSHCRVCRKQTWTPERNRIANVFRRYGITQAEYDRKFTEQNGVCAICSKPEDRAKYLAVDHNHGTNQVRGLLCQRCNSAIGLLKEDPNRLQAAIDYLRGWDAHAIEQVAA